MWSDTTASKFANDFERYKRTQLPSNFSDLQMYVPGFPSSCNKTALHGRGFPEFFGHSPCTVILCSHPLLIIYGQNGSGPHHHLPKSARGRGQNRDAMIQVTGRKWTLYLFRGRAEPPLWGSVSRVGSCQSRCTDSTCAHCALRSFFDRNM